MIQCWQPHYTITKTSLEGEKSKHYCYPKIKKHFIVLGQSNHSTKQQSSVDLLSMEKFSLKLKDWWAVMALDLQATLQILMGKSYLTTAYGKHIQCYNNN